MFDERLAQQLRNLMHVYARLKEFANFREHVMRIMTGQVSRFNARKDSLQRCNQEARKERGELLLKRFTPFSQSGSPNRSVQRSTQQVVLDRGLVSSLKIKREREEARKKAAAARVEFEFDNPFSKKYGASLVSVYRKSLLTPSHELESTVDL